MHAIKNYMSDLNLVGLNLNLVKSNHYSTHFQMVQKGFFSCSC